MKKGPSSPTLIAQMMMDFWGPLTTNSSRSIVAEFSEFGEDAWKNLENLESAGNWEFGMDSYSLLII